MNLLCSRPATVTLPTITTFTLCMFGLSSSSFVRFRVSKFMMYVQPMRMPWRKRWPGGRCQPSSFISVSVVGTKLDGWTAATGRAG
jgi:hypothetical protein